MTLNQLRQRRLSFGGDTNEILHRCWWWGWCWGCGGGGDGGVVVGVVLGVWKISQLHVFPHFPITLKLIITQLHTFSYYFILIKSITTDFTLISSTDQCPNGWKKSKIDCLRVSTRAVTYKEAKDYCSQQGATLPFVTSVTENEELTG